MAEEEVRMLESKVVLLGDTGVGKSSISMRFTRNIFESNPTATVGANYAYKTMIALSFVGCRTNGSNRITLQIWDTAGQERYRSLAPMYYRGAEGAIVVYDITTSNSLNRARDWIQEITADGDEPLAVVLVANKADLQDLRRIPEEDGAQFARSVGASFFETSAKDNKNIDELFIDLAQRLIAQKCGGALPRPQIPSGSAILTGLKEKETAGCCS